MLSGCWVASRFTVTLSGTQNNKTSSLSQAGSSGTLQEPAETSKQPIRTRYLGHVTGYQPITQGPIFNDSVGSWNPDNLFAVSIGVDRSVELFALAVLYHNCPLTPFILW
eukprot:sb/3477251/